MADLDFSSEQPTSEQGTPQKGQLDYSHVYGEKEPVGQPVNQAQEPVISSDMGTLTDDELDDAMADEVAILEELNPDGDYDYDNEVTPEIVEATKSIRLLIQGNLQEAAPLIMSSAEAACQQAGNTAEGRRQLLALGTYVSSLNANSDMNFLAEIVRCILQTRAGV